MDTKKFATTIGLAIALSFLIAGTAGTSSFW